MASPNADIPFTIRRAVVTDAEAICDVYLASRMSAMPWLTVLHSQDDVRNWLATYVIPFSHVFVAESDKGAILGFASLKDDTLDHLYVRPDMQRHGVGDALLNAVMAQSPERLRLYTFARNTLARRFYEKRGFHQVASSDGARNEEGEPDILLEVEISPKPAA